MIYYDQLINKLDRFTRKYYLNQLIRGFLYTAAILLALFIAFNLLEHNFYFDRGGRKLLFFGFIGASLLTIGYWVMLPLLKYFSLGRQISHEQAANIIGNHFGSVEDKLLNVLQLKKQAGSGASDLVLASINQKTEGIKLVPFRSAIDLGKNKKYLRYALPPALLLGALLLGAPSLITEPTHRIINNGQEFERAAPFHFQVANDNLKVVQYDDLTVTAEVTGESLPDEVFIDVDDFQYRMKKQDGNTFTYTFKNVQKDLPFHFFSGPVKSLDHEVNVLLKPNLAEFTLGLDYPGYTGRRDENLSNVGDVTIPEGTTITWNFKAENTDAVQMKFNSAAKLVETERRSDESFRATKRVKENDLYKVFISNSYLPNPDSITYALNVIPDKHPTIAVESFVDSTESALVFFAGSASDDYGLTALTFNHTITKANGAQTTESELLENPKGRETQYEYTFDINTLELKPGEKVSYYFEVKDNDGVNGSKSAKTSVMEFEKPTVEEFEEQEDANEEEIKNKLEEALDESKKIQEQLKKLREKMLQKQEPSWEDKKELEKLLERQRELQEQMKAAKEKFDENLKNQEEFAERQEEILEKQEKMQEMFEEVMDNEMEEMMEKIQELMEELDKDQMLDQMEEMKLNEEEMEMEMDRLMELFKNLEVEKEMQDIMEKLEELAEEQEELAEKTEKEEQPSEELQKEQEELNKEMEKLEEDMKETEKKNEELERPKDLGEDNEEQMDDIQEDMEQSKEKMENSDSQGASKKQKQAAQKMKKMAGAMNAAMQSGEQEQMQEDIKALRQLLENLVMLSFDQEELNDDLNDTEPYTPRYTKITAQQFKLKDDFGLIRDSLVALAKRNDKIESFVTEKVTEVKDNLEESLNSLECENCSQTTQREKGLESAMVSQRQVMKNVNDLALMLSESMEQMQQQMSGMMSGSQMCNKPGSSSKPGSVPMDKITEGQEGLNEQMKEMAKKQGKKGKPGQEGGQGNSAKDFAKAAARQAALRRALEEMAEERGEQGKGASEELQQLIEQMDKVEVDLVNKRLDNQLLLRQQDILTRLLEAEKADRQRDKDEKRKAETGKETKKELPPALVEYLKEREAETEMYNKVSPSLRPFYKQLVDEYFKALKEQ